MLFKRDLMVTAALITTTDADEQTQTHYICRQIYAAAQQKRRVLRRGDTLNPALGSRLRLRVDDL